MEAVPNIDDHVTDHYENTSKNNIFQKANIAYICYIM